jgi:PPP family 3-phenylpropionic acid transporter
VKIQLRMSGYYFFFYFGMGVLFPMMGIYLDDTGLSGSQLGTIMAVGPVVSMFAQPLWGIICDRYQNPNRVLTAITLLSAIVVLGYLVSKQYYYLILMAALLSLFHSAIGPLADSLTANYTKKYGGDFGSIRLWGSVGFALAVWMAGMVIEVTFMAIIFYLFAVSLLVSAWFAKGIPNETSEAGLIRADVKSGLKRLVRIPPYVLFILSSFLIFGPIIAHFFYFGIYYMSIGGTIAGVGLFFLCAVGSEAPFMRMASYFINRFGLVTPLLIASGASAFRNFFYYTEPGVIWIFITSILQGLTVGLFFPAAVQFIRDLAPEDVKVTAMSLYTSIGQGLAAVSFSLFAGFIYEYYSIVHTYLFFGFTTLLGMVCLGGIAVWQRKRGRKQEAMQPASMERG